MNLLAHVGIDVVGRVAHVGPAREVVPLPAPRAPAAAAEPAAACSRLSAVELFERFDADGSGTIDADELTEVLRSVGYAVRENTVIALLAAHCRGLDEELDRSEFAAVLRELDARALFARFDADGSGTIDGDELARALASVGRAEFGPAAVKVSARAACRRRASPGPRES